MPYRINKLSKIEEEIIDLLAPVSGIASIEEKGGGVLVLRSKELIFTLIREIPLMSTSGGSSHLALAALALTVT